MADSETGSDIVKWIREVELPKLFGQNFKKKSLLLKSGGKYEFNTVSEDDNMIAVISTLAGEHRVARWKRQTFKKSVLKSTGC
jgi:hypothetical protein